MATQEQLKQLAHNILTKSVMLKKGDLVYLEADGKATRKLFVEFIKEITRLGGVPFYYFNDAKYKKAWIESANVNQVKKQAQIHADIMKKADCYIAIRGSDNIYDLSSIKPEKMQLYSKEYISAVHNKIRVPKTRWCIMRYPNDNMSVLAGMSTEEFNEFYFNACLVDYAKMRKNAMKLAEYMNKTDRVKIVAPNTKLEFSIKNIPAIACCGEVNIPDGEVYTAPVKDSINGKVKFNTQTVYNGVLFSNIELEFKNGKIVKATSDVNNDKLQKILNTDSGAKYMGEFALGFNPYVTKPILDILFDEKINGSFHMAIGNSYDDAPNGNKSAIHWDLVQIQTKEHGGGEIWFDDKLIRKDGKFVIKELKNLNFEK